MKKTNPAPRAAGRTEDRAGAVRPARRERFAPLLAPHRARSAWGAGKSSVNSGINLDVSFRVRRPGKCWFVVPPQQGCNSSAARLECQCVRCHYTRSSSGYYFPRDGGALHPDGLNRLPSEFRLQSPGRSFLAGPSLRFYLVGENSSARVDRAHTDGSKQQRCAAGMSDSD